MGKIPDLAFQRSNLSPNKVAASYNYPGLHAYKMTGSYRRVFWAVNRLDGLGFCNSLHLYSSIIKLQTTGRLYDLLSPNPRDAAAQCVCFMICMCKLIEGDLLLTQQPLWMI